MKSQETQQPHQRNAKRNQETRTRLLGKDGNGKTTTEEQDGNYTENNTENKATNEDEAHWISTSARTTDDEEDEAMETTHKTHSPEGTQSITNIKLETFLQLCCIIPEGKRENRRRTDTGTQWPQQKQGKIAHRTHEKGRKTTTKNRHKRNEIQTINSDKKHVKRRKQKKKGERQEENYTQKNTQQQEMADEREKNKQI